MVHHNSFFHILCSWYIVLECNYLDHGVELSPNSVMTTALYHRAVGRSENFGGEGWGASRNRMGHNGHNLPPPQFHLVEIKGSLLPYPPMLRQSCSKYNYFLSYKLRTFNLLMCIVFHTTICQKQCTPGPWLLWIPVFQFSLVQIFKKFQKYILGACDFHNS